MALPRASTSPARSGALAKRRDHGAQRRQAGRSLADARPDRDDAGHARREHGERPASREGRRGREDAPEARLQCGHGHRLTGTVVVTGEVLLVEPDGGGNALGGEIEHGEALDPYLPDAATDLGRIDARIDEVAEQLRPGRSLLVRRVPDARTTSTVVAALRDGRVSDGTQPVAGGSLVPEAPPEVLLAETLDGAAVPAQT